MYKIAIIEDLNLLEEHKYKVKEENHYNERKRKEFKYKSGV